MRELHGVLSIATTDYKPYALFFDKLHVVGLERFQLNNESSPEVDRISAELEFLEARGLIVPVSGSIVSASSPEEADNVMRLASIEPVPTCLLRDVFVRGIAGRLPSTDCDLVPICEAAFPELLTPSQPRSSSRDVLRVALEVMPVPDDNCAWEDILDFKREEHDKQWGFRRFLQQLATKSQAEAEIRDEFEWRLNEYSNSMKIHNLKSSMSLVEVVVLGIGDIVQSLITHDWTKVTKGALSIEKRKVELLEAEMKAPGRECAYVFDAKKRFGPK